MKAIAITTVILFLFLFTSTAEAKVLPQARKVSTAKNTRSAGIIISPKLRSDRRALLVYFGNLQNVSAVSYMLTYKTSVQNEGAMGALNLSLGSSQNSELLFGTCSKNICRYHTGIKDVKFDISYTLKSGKKYLRKFKIKL